MNLTVKDAGVIGLTSAEGATAAVLHHGGQLTSWRSGNGVENIYLSERADFSPGSAIRGGAPVCFPQFSVLGDLPLHGFARNQIWTPVEAGSDTSTVARLQLTDKDETRAIWPYAFAAELQVVLEGDAIEISLSATNTGATEFSFTAALHTYFRVAAIEDVVIGGLRNVRYLDKLEGNVIRTQGDERLWIDRPLDRIYYGASGERVMEEGSRKLMITTQGMPDTVIWNPGPERCAGIPDLPNDAWRHFVCIEAAVIEHPIVLAPGATWRGAQRVRAIGG